MTLSNNHNHFHFSILFIEDEEVICQEMKLLFNKYFHRYFITSYYEEALSLFHKEMPDVVITDIQLGGQTGLALAREIKKFRPETKIIIQTAYTDSDYLMEAINIGVYKFLTKPIDFERLLGIMTDIEEERNIRHNLHIIRDTLRDTTQILSQYQRLLESSENRFNAIVESSQEAIVILNGKGNISAMNPVAKKMFGYPNGDSIGQHASHLISSEYHAVFTPIFHSLDFQKETDKLQIQCVRYDHSVFMAEMGIRAFQKEDATYYFIVIYDMTARRVNEETLSIRLRYEKGLSECAQILLENQDPPKTIDRALHKLLEASDVGRVYVFENFTDAVDGLCCRQTHEVCREGVSPQINNELLRHVPYSHFPRWRESLSQNIPIVGNVADFPDTERADLEPQRILSVLVLPLWVNGKWRGFIGFDETKSLRVWNEEDINLLKTAAILISSYIEHLKTQQEIADSEKWMQFALENSNSGVVEWLVKERMIRASSNLWKMWGYSENPFRLESYSMESWVAMIHPDDMPMINKKLEEFIQGRISIITVKYRNLCQNGSYKWMHFQGKSVEMDALGVPQKVIGILTDVSKQLEVEEREKMLLKSQYSSMKEILHNISHHWRQPLNAVSLIAQNIVKRIENGDFDSILVSNRATQLNNIIVGLSKTIDDFAESFREDEKRQTIPLKALIQKVVVIIQSHYFQDGIDIITDLEGGVIRNTLPNLLTHILLTILRNSHDAFSEKSVKKPFIKIALFTEGERFTLTIADNAGGIAKEALPKLFEPYFTTKDYHAGLGLYIARTALEEKLNYSIEAVNIETVDDAEKTIGAQITIREN